jgi:hypothetical protein
VPALLAHPLTVTDTAVDVPLVAGAAKVTTALQVPGLSWLPGMASTPHWVESAVGVAGREAVCTVAPIVMVSVQVPPDTTASGMIAFAVACAAVASQPARVMITFTVLVPADPEVSDGLGESALGLNGSVDVSVLVLGVVGTADDADVVGVLLGDPLVPLVQPASATARTAALILTSELKAISPVRVLPPKPLFPLYVR